MAPPPARGGPRRAPRPRARFSPGGAGHAASVFLRERLEPGHRMAGPSILIEPHQTLVVEPGWEARITERNHVVLERVVPLARRQAIGTEADPVMLEIFNNLFMSIAEQMGVSLQN